MPVAQKCVHDCVVFAVYRLRSEHERLLCGAAVGFWF
jgi:hypothetical protein